ncbi:MAG: amidohydrolase family protein [Chloroflexota bacterium]|nr:amidohydrolase family protein [Chloroflexota bacterium]MDE2920788.1 amidohydrolase family protein [Chloroflexota bacterium]
MEYDLLIAAGHIEDPARGLRGSGFVATSGDRIAITAIGTAADEAPTARRQLDFPNGVLLPGLVDMHAHPAIEDSKYGIDPDVHFLPRGTTTVMSQGDAGARNWPRYRERLIERARTRVRMAINLSASGESTPSFSLGDPSEADVDACVNAIRDGGELIWGIAINVAEAVCGNSDPREMLRRAIQAGEATDRPLLVGTRHAEDFPLDELLEQLRPGDVVTYCLHGLVDRIARDGRVLDCVWRARERGVLFDTGHGMGSFDFEVAETVIKEGFLPDTISTDQYRRHVGSSPQHDLPLTVSKLLAVGMREEEAWPRITSRPAELLGLQGEVGTLAPGACADLVVLTEDTEEAALHDVSGNERPGRIWSAAAVLRDGEVVTPLGQ